MGWPSRSSIALTRVEGGGSMSVGRITSVIESWVAVDTVGVVRCREIGRVLAGSCKVAHTAEPVRPKIREGRCT